MNDKSGDPDGGVAAGDEKNAEKIFNWLIGFSLLVPKGQIHVIRELNLIMGGTISFSSGPEYSIPYSTEEQKEVEQRMVESRSNDVSLGINGSVRH